MKASIFKNWNTKNYGIFEMTNKSNHSAGQIDYAKAVLVETHTVLFRSGDARASILVKLFVKR